MATVQPAVPSPAHKVHRGVEPLRAGQGSSFLLRKLHSLLGIIPIGAFLLEHLLSNFEALKGPIAYGEQVKFLNSLPLVRVLEWVFIFLPILYHAIYGVYIWLRGKSNIVYYPWAGNWMYLAQRYTGLIAFAYIAYHVATQRFMGVSLPENPGAAFAKVQHELANPWILAVYVIAMIAVCWHFAYGIWLFAAKWGITPGEIARRRFGYICFVFGVLIAGMGLASIWAFVGPKYPNAPNNVPLSYQRTEEMREQRSLAAVEPGKSAVTVGDPVGWSVGIC
jgi:succinate dehydrogenase / fumarate reductase cytochrome b subunit